MITKEQILKSITFDGFYSKYFSDHKNMLNGEWQVVCPFHEDKDPSMNLNMKTGLFNCFGCGINGDIFSFYMKKHGVDFPEAIKRIAGELGIQEDKPKIVKTYDYFDAKGNFVSQTVRYEPKKFSQRTKKDGEWAWTLEGVKTVLYNLAAVIKAKQVFVMEGEKDCDTANSLGYVATTNPMGAGKWRDDYNPYLFGKEVILFPDNDAVGIKHMIQIGNAIREKSQVKWFDIPGKNCKGFDFTDYVNSFKNEFESMKQIDTLVRSARLFDPSQIIIPEPDTKESEQIKNWILISPGEFSVKDLDYELGFKEPDQKILRTKILEKFVAEKIISREGKRRGVYRPYKKELEPMNYLNANDNFLPLWLPLGLHKMVGIMPGNIIIFSGEPNAGKSALMFNIIKSNMNKFDVHYFNSEAGEGELKNRLSKFEDIGIKDWNFNAYSRDGDFADVVFQGQRSLNIIDFLEVHDEFYLVGQKIKEIHMALKGAVAIIAIQRNKGNEFGLGGSRTMEKARLVVNVEPGKLKITKAKNFIDPRTNPNGMSVDFKLANGCKFVMQGQGWYRNGSN
ncbi:hypothetical protein C4588_06205 [Candidatus Parcubacteria bacterium]|nr:MAG: hypothetical protein C4588_06205 [Candidatus Parcubacteria bacterium]